MCTVAGCFHCWSRVCTLVYCSPTALYIIIHWPYWQSYRDKKLQRNFKMEIESRLKISFIHLSTFSFPKLFCSFVNRVFYWGKKSRGQFLVALKMPSQLILRCDLFGCQTATERALRRNLSVSGQAGEPISWRGGGGSPTSTEAAWVGLRRKL